MCVMTFGLLFQKYNTPMPIINTEVWNKNSKGGFLSILQPLTSPSGHVDFSVWLHS